MSWKISPNVVISVPDIALYFTSAAAAAEWPAQMLPSYRAEVLTCVHRRRPDQVGP